jgi:hypothetical protein
MIWMNGLGNQTAFLLLPGADRFFFLVVVIIQWRLSVILGCFGAWVYWIGRVTGWRFEALIS